MQEDVGFTAPTKLSEIFLSNLDIKNMTAQKESNSDKPLHPKEIESISIIIASLARLAHIDIRKGGGAPQAIKNQAEALGCRISENKILKYLDPALNHYRPPD